MSLLARSGSDDAVARATVLGGLLAGAAALAALSLQGLAAPCEGAPPCRRTLLVDPLARLALGAFAGGSLTLAATAATGRPATSARRGVRRVATGAVALPWAAGAAALGVGWWLAVAPFRPVAPVDLAPVALAGAAALCLLGAALVASLSAVRGDGGGREATADGQWNPWTVPPVAGRPRDLRATLLGTGRAPVVAVALGAALLGAPLALGAGVASSGPRVVLDLVFLAAAVAVPAAVAARGEGLAAAWAGGGAGWLALYHGPAAAPPVVGGAVLAAAVQTLAWGSLGYVLGTGVRRWGREPSGDGARRVATRERP